MKEKQQIDMPIYRAKTILQDFIEETGNLKYINGVWYAVGMLIKNHCCDENYKEYFIDSRFECSFMKSFPIFNGNTKLIDRNTLSKDYILQIDPSTLAIHFPDMIDSEGTKIFASLSEDGKGGDIFIINGIKCILYIKAGKIYLRNYGDTNIYGLVERKVTGIQE